MPRITALEPDPRRPGAVRLVVDGQPFCTLHEGAAALGLVPGAEWDPSLQAGATAAADEEAAWRTLLRALERRAFAIQELRRRLRQKGHPPAAVEYAMDRALAAGLLDDAAYARMFVSSRAARGRGPGRLRRDLLALGVAPAHIDAALAEQFPEPEDSLAMARQLAERRLRQLQGIPPEARRRRVLAYLARRGFHGSAVAELVARALRGKS